MTIRAPKNNQMREWWTSWKDSKESNGQFKQYSIIMFEQLIWICQSDLIIRELWKSYSNIHKVAYCIHRNKNLPISIYSHWWIRWIDFLSAQMFMLNCRRQLIAVADNFCSYFSGNFARIITSFCGHFTYTETLWKLWNEAWNDTMEIFCFRHTFFLWPYMNL